MTAATEIDAPARHDWLIWSRKHGGWWRSNCQGYTDTLAFAGLYTEEQARGLFSSTWPNGDESDLPVHLTKALDKLEAERADLEDRLARIVALNVKLRTYLRSPEAPADLAILSPRVRNLLKAEGCATFQDVAELSEAELRRIPGVGVGTIHEIKAVLATAGLELAP